MASLFSGGGQHERRGSAQVCGCLTDGSNGVAQGPLEPKSAQDLTEASGLQEAESHRVAGSHEMREKGLTHPDPRNREGLSRSARDLRGWSSGEFSNHCGVLIAIREATVGAGQVVQRCDPPKSLVGRMGGIRVKNWQAHSDLAIFAGYAPQ